MNSELEIAKKHARSFSALDTPAGEYLGAVTNSRGETNYYYLLDGEYRYDCDNVRWWRAQRNEDKKTERQKALKKERLMYR